MAASVSAGTRNETVDKFGGVEAIQQVINESIPAAGSTYFDLDVTGFSSLTVWFRLLATVTPADLTGWIGLFADDGVTVATNGFATVRTVAAASDGTNVNQFNQYDVRGIAKVRVNVKNGNAAAKVGVANVYLGREATR